jgi:hypothetical protein
MALTSAPPLFKSLVAVLFNRVVLGFQVVNHIREQL